MAYQPKSYRKFVATTATAAMVASAVAPVVSAAGFTDVAPQYKDAIDFLVSTGATNGKTETKFGVYDEITRLDAAVILAKVLKLDVDNAKDAGFTDVPADRAKYVNALVEAGILNGKTETRFGAYDKLTRVEMAKIIANAYNLKGDDVTLPFTDVNDTWAPYVKALYKNGVAKGKTETKFGAYENITRGDFARFVYNAHNATVAPEVISVSAINATTLTVTGTALNKLTAEDITVENNTVKSFTASADGKSATVVLNNQLVPDVVTKVTVKGVSFDVTYKVEAKSVSVVSATYDDDTKNQFVAIQVDGKSVTAQELINAGYTLNFEAYLTKAATTPLTTELFGANTNTGELRTDLNDAGTAGTLANTLGGNLPTAGQTVYVKVTLTKGSEVITSDLTPITIKNLDLAANSITAATLENYGRDGNDATWANDFYQSSSTLVTGEKAKFVEIKVKAGSDEEKVTSGYSVKSSDVSVVSVDSNGVLTAEGPGTATVTISYGGATYTKTFTVTNTARKPASIKADKTSLTLSQGATVTTTFKLLDQYGDPMPFAAGDVVLRESDNTKVAASISAYPSDETGEATLQFVGQNAGKGTNTVTFYDAAGAKIGTTAVTATVTDNDTLAKYSLAVDSDISSADVAAINTALGGGTLTASDISTDATLDLQSDKYVKINISGLNSEGVKVSNQEVDGTNGDYTVTVNQSKAGVLAEIGGAGSGVYALAENGFIVLEAGTETGTATITVKNANNNNIVATFKVTVESVGYNVTGATLKDVPSPTYATTLNYEDFLSYTAADKDPVISGIKLTKASAQPVRLDIDGDTGSTVGTLYIDKNADGVFAAADGDKIVGSVTMSTIGSIADASNYTDVVDGIEVAPGDDGTVLFKVLDNNGAVVATKAVKVDF